MKIIGLCHTSPADQKLFEWLSSAFAVRFEERQPGHIDALDALIVFANAPMPARDLPGGNLPLLLLPIRSSEEETAGAARWEFAGASMLPRLFRGRTVEQNSPGVLSRLQPANGDVVLASISSAPAWLARQDGERRIDTVAASLPKALDSQILYDHFQPGNFVRLLPLIDFLRRLTGEDQWQKPCQPACFMFDDPNLHSSRYGWLNYPDLAAQAREQNYHVAFATVPLDAWFARKGAAAFFSGEQARLSLLVHGNDHLQEELSSYSSEQEALRSLAQALRRIRRLEDRLNIKVCRVMAPPHGTCSEETLRIMARLGFEAACTTLSWLTIRNQGKPWTRSMGLNVAEVVAGLPVMPRLRLVGQPETAVLLAAYLERPIIPYGHHQDVARGLDGMGRLAAFINSLGNVRWMRMNDIAQVNYKTRHRNGVLQVKSFSRVFRMVVPPEVHSLSVQRSWLTQNEPDGLRIRGGEAAERTFPKYGGEAIAVEPGERLEIASQHPHAVDPSSVPVPRPKVWAFFRRQFCEARDQLAPTKQRLLRRSPAA